MDNKENGGGVVSSIPRPILWISLAVVVGVILWYFRQATVYVLISAVLAFVGRPLVRLFCKAHISRFYMPRWLAATFTLIILWCVLGGLVALTAPLVAGKIIDLSNLISDSGSTLNVVLEPLQTIQKYITDTLGLPAVQSDVLLDDFVQRLLKFLNYDTVTSVLSSIIDLGSSLVIALFSISFISFFFLKEDGLFSKMVAAIFPDEYSENVYRAINKISVLLSRYFTGLLTESLIIATAIAVVLLLFVMQFENACFIAIVMGMLNVIPYAGPAIGVLVSLFIGIVSPIAGCTIPYTLAVICGVIGVVKGIDDFVLQPTIYSSKVSAHPLEIFIVILMAGSIGQIVGLLVAVPTYTILRVFAKEFLSEVPLVNKLTKEI